MTARRNAAVLVMAALAIFAPHALASPLETADAFWKAYARGDVAAALAQWQPGRDARFGAAFQRETEIRCSRVMSVAMRTSVSRPASAAIEVDAVVQSGTGGRVEDEHYVLDLRATSRGWQVTDFARREERLVDEMLRAPLDRRSEILDAHGELFNPRLAAALSRRAVLLTSRQRDGEAEAFLEMARRIAELTASDAARSAVRAAESVHLRRNAPAGDPGPIALAEEAERLALRSGHPDAVADARVRLARALEIVDVPRAERLLLSVVGSADALFDTTSVAMAAAQLAWICAGRLDHGQSFRYALLASHHAELSGDPSARLNAAMTLVGAVGNSHDLELVRMYLEKAVAVARESSAMVAELSLLARMATLDSEPMNSETLRRARELAACMGAPGDVHSAPLLAMAARDAIARNDLGTARGHLLPAYDLLSRTVTDDRILASVLLTEADALLHAQQPLEALEVVEEARTLLETHAEWETDGMWSVQAARALRMLGRREEAMAVLRGAVEEMERQRDSAPLEVRARQSFFGGQHDLLVEMLVEAGRNEEALVLAERRTARALQDFVRSPGAVQRAGSPEIERAERTVVELNRIIRSARPGDPSLLRNRERLVAARLQLDDLRMRHAAADDPVPAGSGAAPLDLAALAPRQAIVRYVVTPRGTTAFVIRKRGGRASVTAHPLPTGERELHTRVESLLDRILARDNRYRGHARALHDLLLAPLLGALEGAERVAIVPDGPLWPLPFQTLQDARGVPLLARFELHYAPSVSWCLRGPSPFGRPRSILAVGDPEISGAGQAMFRSLVPGSALGQLPDAAREVRQLARLYPHARVLTGAAANEPTLRSELPRHDIVHLATHALIDETQPLYSSLVLAGGGPQDDGLLEARELQALDLGAGLFVLSGCSTARGRSYAGEGVVGLAWALLSRGVPRVVVSQWNADSKATTRLMVAFHRFLVAGHTPAAALRKAQLELRKDVRYEDPLYWAPFVVLGS